MGLFDNVPVVSDVEDAAGTAATAALDVPADAVNATTGTGENLGWFGAIDRGLDPRGISEEEAAEPSADTTGLSGFFAAGTGSTSELGSDVGDVTTKPVMSYLGFDGSGGNNQQKQQQNKPQQQGGGLPIGMLALASIALAGAYAYSKGGL